MILTNGAIVLASCVWTLTFPHDQTDGTFAALPSILGRHELSGSQASLYSNMAWSTLLCIVLGVVNPRLCRAEKLLRRPQQTR
ncbi:MAG: hypothetical protein L0H93_15255 [Nocardioides sp.]|nr:hypothetical protein [Nocardioides sp.]